MGDEVSKKDLQAFQASVNRQIAELSKQLSDQKRDSHKDVDEVDGVIVRVRSDLEKRLDRVDDRFKEVQDSINTLARAIGDLAKKVK
jgi:chromosome segregation ATPase